MKLKDISFFISDKVPSKDVPIEKYIDTDSLLAGKYGRREAIKKPLKGSLTAFKKGDVLVSNIRPYLKKIYFAEEDGGCSSDVLVFRSTEKKLEKFLYAVLLQDNFFLHMMRGAKGSKMPRGDKSQIMEYKFSPIVGEEEQIGDLIDRIQRKIKNLTEINCNLEAMARQIYENWFVQFNFPNEKGLPYKSSGGKMVWNEKLSREIPENWSQVNLSIYLTPITEKLRTFQKNEKIYTPIEIIPRKKMSFCATVPIEDAVSGLCRYRAFDILLSNRRVYFHKVCIAPTDGITRDTVIVLRPEFDKLGYAFEVVFSDHFIKFATLHSYGSEQPVLSWDVAKNYPCTRSDNHLEESFSEICNQIIMLVIKNENEIRELVKQRDELLPFLINGQVSVVK